MMDGRLYMDAPAHPEFYQHSLFVLVHEGRFYGKYPLGWPAILGAFDAAGIGFAANAVMAALAVVLAGLVGSELAGRRVGLLAAGVMALSPWLWFHGSTFASHVAATCAVWAFVWMLLRMWRLSDEGAAARRVLAWAAGAGLVLGAALLIRPFDAAMFTLPAVVLVLAGLVRCWRRWLPLGTVIAVGACVGLGIYLWSLTQTTGSIFISPYAQEERWEGDWQITPLGMAGRAVFQWVELNGRFPGWGIGGLVLAAGGLLVLLHRRGQRGLARGGAWVVVAAAVGLFFAGSCIFGFTNTWWGPRWLLPVAPLMAILIAVLVDAALRTAARRGHGPDLAAGGWRARRAVRNAPAAARLLLLFVVASALVGLLRYGGQYHEHVLAPPHTVSAAAWRATRQLENAVVAMPTAGDRAPLDARAGMAYMRVPFEANQVIYVRNAPDWESRALAMYPGRDLYRIDPAPHAPRGFSLIAVTTDAKPTAHAAGAEAGP